ncbi:MAG: class I SAM-dependent methyltransferase [Nitrospira sp.]|nr:class I SAM-dependent methyltransferase [Nitrospira sp.]
MAGTERADKINEMNRRTYGDLKIVSEYSSGEIQDPEKAILDEIRNEITGKKLLDIGVGVGRTIATLKQISNDYIGIDYSQAMVDECNRRYPDTKVILDDARNMSGFKDGEFDCVFFTYNAIDYVSHEDRLKMLHEIFRVLKKGGCFVFSSHNKHCLDFPGYVSLWSPLHSLNPFRKFVFNPVKFASKVFAMFKGILNHLRNSKYVIHTDDYSIINDKEQIYQIMTYYISIASQRQQLQNIGFKPDINAYDRYGNIIDKESHNTWIYYLARK